MRCGPSNSEPQEASAAAFQTVGRDGEQSRAEAMMWGVKAAPATEPPIDLWQRTAASIHPPPRIGDDGAIILQTLADAEVQTGVHKQSSAVATIVLIALKSLSRPARTMRISDHQPRQAT